MYRIAVIHAPIAHYRVDFYNRLAARSDVQLTVFTQSSLFDSNIKFANQELNCEVLEMAYWGRNNPFWVWQHLPVVKLLKGYDVYVFYGNPRYLSNLVWATIFRMFNRPVVLWGQGHTAGANQTTERLRLLWWQLFENIIVYTDQEKKLLQEQFANTRITAINNGINLDSVDKAISQWSAPMLEKWQRDNQVYDRRILLSVARLIKKNRFDLMADVLSALTISDPDILWCVVGDGPEALALREQVEQKGLSAHVRWIGAEYDEKRLAPWFLSSLSLIHPGAIGLSLIHSFGYGLPVITHGNAYNQMPEFAALKEGINGILFEEGSAKSLLSVVKRLLTDDSLVQNLRRETRATVEAKFTTEVMANRFVDAVRLAFEGKAKST
jgi:glycosyltransferase involved in cell wall biosynthesis